MHVNPENYLDMFKPPDDVLKQCTLVRFYDITTPPWRMKKWCRSNDLSLVWFEFLDMADLDSSQYDTLYKFYFIDPRDATVFSLKYA